MKNFLFFKYTRQNRYSLPALVALVDADPRLSKEVRIVVYRSKKDILWARTMPGKKAFAFSFMTLFAKGAQEDAAYLKKKIGPGIRLLAGGPHPSGDPQGTLAAGFDTVLVGAGERMFPKLLRKIFLGDEEDFQSNMRGVLHDTEGPVDLDLYPPFSPKRRMFRPIEISRGCSWACRFCQTPRLFHGKVVHRSPTRTYHYLSQAAKSSSWRCYFVASNAFSYGSEKKGAFNVAAIEDLLKAAATAGMKEIIFGSFPSEVRPENVRKDILALVRKYCINTHISIGAQSGSDRILKAMGRGHTREEIRDASFLLNREGFVPILDFIFGYPGEKEEDQRETLSLIDELICKAHARVHNHYFLPLPGTPAAGLSPAPIHPDVRSSLREFEETGSAFGFWEAQERFVRSTEIK